MALTTGTVTGTFADVLAAGKSGKIRFSLSGPGIEPDEGVASGETVVDITGGTFSVDLWANSAGANPTYYDVFVDELGAGGRLGRIFVSGAGGNLSTLLAAGITSIPAYYSIIPSANIGALNSGNIVLDDTGATFNVDMSGSAFVTDSFDNTSGKVVVTDNNGWMGLGSDDLQEIESGDLESLNDHTVFFQFAAGTLNSHPEISAGSGIVFARGGSSEQRLLIGNSGDLGIKAYSGGSWDDIFVWTSRNVTDVNGVLVDGRAWSAVTDVDISDIGIEVTGAVFTKTGTGVYEITGTNGLAIGFNRLVLPRNEGSGDPIVHASVSESAGTITLNTFDPTGGLPMDIPGGRYIGVKIALT